MASRINPSLRNRLLALAVLAVCAFCVVFPRPWQGNLRGAAHAAARRPQHALATSHNALRRAFDRVADLWSAAGEVERLREENRALREALAQATSEAEGAGVRLRNFTAFEDFRHTLDQPSLRIIPATVVAVDSSSWRHSVVVDRGSDHGVRLGAPAVWGNSIVGTVVALRPSVATVRLLHDSRAGLKVRVARTGDVGLLRGTAERDGLLRLKWLHLRPAKKGDLIVSSGLDTAIPPGLVAGRVVHAPATRDHLFYDVRVSPLIDLDRLGELLLVIYSAPDVEELLEEGPSK